MTDTAEVFKMLQSSGVSDQRPTIDATRRELDLILHSRTFQRAKRLRSLLDYVVTAATNGLTSGQSQTAKDLFGKGEDFDPSIDPVIRVQFGRLRRALANYYSSEGQNDPVVIGIPNRRYTPVFETKESAMEPKTNGYHAALKMEAKDPGKDVVERTRPLIAVLPFANLTSDPSQDAFCYGLTEEIANGLAAHTAVDVVANSSTFQFKDVRVDVREVGRELGAPLILEGSVRMEDGQTRIIAQLARSEDGVAVWSHSFEDTMHGSLDTQKSIAERVMQNLPLSAELV